MMSPDVEHDGVVAQTLHNEPDQMVLELPDVITVNGHGAATRPEPQAATVDVEFRWARADNTLVNHAESERGESQSRIMTKEP
jgi:hypothetical protein